MAETPFGMALSATDELLGGEIPTAVGLDRLKELAGWGGRPGEGSNARATIASGPKSAAWGQIELVTCSHVQVNSTVSRAEQFSFHAAPGGAGPSPSQVDSAGGVNWSVIDWSASRVSG